MRTTPETLRPSRILPPINEGALPSGVTTATLPDSLNILSATRRARVAALLARLDRAKDEGVDRTQLAYSFVRQGRSDHRDWTPAQLDQAIDDLAAAGLATVRAEGWAGTLVVYRTMTAVAQ